MLQAAQFCTWVLLIRTVNVYLITDVTYSSRLIMSETQFSQDTLFNSVLREIILLGHFGKSKALVKHSLLLPLPAVLSIWARLHVSSGLPGSGVGKKGHRILVFLQFIFPACVKARRPNRNTLRLVYTTPINSCLLGWCELVVTNSCLSFQREESLKHWEVNWLNRWEDAEKYWPALERDAPHFSITESRPVLSPRPV